MARKNRDRISIIAAILEAANSGTCKTRIMLKANLSYKLLNKYLNLVIDLKLVRYENSVYSLTKDGHVFLKQYLQLHDRYYNAKEMLKTLDHEYQELSRFCGTHSSQPHFNSKIYTGIELVPKKSGNIVV